MANQTRTARLTIIALTLVVASATVPSQVRGPVVGAISGEMIVKSPDNRTIGKLEATVSYSLPNQGGDTNIRFTPSDPATTVSASAEFTAVRQEDAFGAVTALMLALAGRVGHDRTSLKLSNVRFEGDPGVLRPHVDAIIGWWDEQASIAVPDYLSPVLSSEHIGTLVLNVWGTEGSSSSNAVHGYAILMFHPASPQSVSSGTIVRRDQHAASLVVNLPGLGVFGQLIPMTHTPMQNDYFLAIFRPLALPDVEAELVIEPLPDGTFDVRGLARRWFSGGAFTVEGIGTTKFVPPGS
jgi:hypothetical protein